MRSVVGNVRAELVGSGDSSVGKLPEVLSSSSATVALPVMAELPFWVCKTRSLKCWAWFTRSLFYLFCSLLPTMSSPESLFCLDFYI